MNKTILITGASRGIGKAVAEFFASKKWNVIINYNTSEKQAQELVKDLSKFTNVIAVKADVSKFKEVKDIIDKSISTFGKIDVLVNNAGITIEKMLIDMTSEEIEKIINTNLLGCIYTTKLVLPKMLEAESGKIINISSIQGEIGASCESIYSASKAGITAFSKSIEQEYNLMNISCKSLELGWVDTDMTAHYTKQDKKNFLKGTNSKSLTARQVAKKIYDLIH